MVTGSTAIILLACMIVLIVLCTGKLKINAFVVLVSVAILYGLLIKMPFADIIAAVKGGFGGTLSSIGIVILAGTIMGVILEKTGAALVMTRTILGLVGKNRTPLAMSIAGYVVSIPVFCDSGYVILSPLNRALAKMSGISMTVMAVALATGLHVTHTMVPPTPGPLAAAGALQADLGLVILFGLIAAFPAALAGCWWATHVASRYNIPAPEGESYDELMEKYGKLPGAFASFLPLVLPIVLILMKSFSDLPSRPFGDDTARMIITNIGDPVIALLLGVICSLFLIPWKDMAVAVDEWMGQGVKDAAIIIAITGAGGAFGRILQGSPMVGFIQEHVPSASLGLFLPFFISSALKIAQGSSTVAIITTANIVFPMLGQLGVHPALVVVAIGAGSNIASHANDSYFWVVSQFSNIPVNTAYKVYTSGTAVCGVVAIAVTYVLSLFIQAPPL